MVKLFEETGEFIYSEYGSVGAFMFKGNKDFIRRAFNLTYNFSIAKKKLFYFGENCYYVIATPDRILKGLMDYFKAQVIINHEVEIEQLGDIDNEEPIELKWDENKVDELALIKATQFWDTKIIKKNLMIEQYYIMPKGLGEYKVQISNKVVDF